MSVNRINLAWDKTWWWVLAKMTMTTLVTMSCSVQTGRLVIGAQEQNDNDDISDYELFSEDW